MSFGYRLRRAREDANLTQTDLGKGLGTNGEDVSKSVVLGWEKDRHFPRADQVVLICERLKCTADYLLLGAKDEDELSSDAIGLARQYDAMEETVKNRALIIWRGIVQLAEPVPDSKSQETPSKKRAAL